MCRKYKTTLLQRKRRLPWQHFIKWFKAGCQWTTFTNLETSLFCWAKPLGWRCWCRPKESNGTTLQWKWILWPQNQTFHPYLKVRLPRLWHLRTWMKRQKTRWQGAHLPHANVPYAQHWWHRPTRLALASSCVMTCQHSGSCWTDVSWFSIVREAFSQQHRRNMTGSGSRTRLCLKSTRLENNNPSTQANYPPFSQSVDVFLTRRVSACRDTRKKRKLL